MSTHDEIVAQMEIYVTENNKFVEKGIKSSATRARKALSEIAKLAKARRAEITDEKDAMDKELYHFQKFFCFCFFVFSFQPSIVSQRLRENIHDFHFRVKRCQRVLKHHLNVLAVFPGFFWGKPCQIFSVV